MLCENVSIEEIKATLKANPNSMFLVGGAMMQVSKDIVLWRSAMMQCSMLPLMHSLSLVQLSKAFPNRMAFKPSFITNALFKRHPHTLSPRSCVDRDSPTLWPRCLRSLRATAPAFSSTRQSRLILMRASLSLPQVSRLPNMCNYTTGMLSTISNFPLPLPRGASEQVGAQHRHAVPGGGEGVAFYLQPVTLKSTSWLATKWPLTDMIPCAID